MLLLKWRCPFARQRRGSQQTARRLIGRLVRLHGSNLVQFLPICLGSQDALLNQNLAGQLKNKQLGNVKTCSQSILFSSFGPCTELTDHLTSMPLSTPGSSSRGQTPPRRKEKPLYAVWRSPCRLHRVSPPCQSHPSTLSLITFCRSC